MNQISHPTAQEIETALGLTPGARRSVLLRRLMIGGVLALLAVAGAAIYLRSAAQSSAVSYETQQATTRDLAITVTATGTIQPVSQVEISSELSGVVREVLVQENDIVKAGQILARLDSERREAQREQALASIAAAETRLADARTTLAQREKLQVRQQSLRKNGLSTPQSYESTLADRDRARNAVNAAEASLASEKANLKIIDTDLEKMKIVSPINGIVLKRAIEPGQTVAASFSAPVLFKIAEDLTNIQVEATVDESEITRVRLGQPASFSVDAWRGRNFPAKIVRLSYAPDTTSGVVTYKTVLSSANKDMSLRPGMTATAVVIVEDLKNVLVVTNEALRYMQPEKEEKKKFSLTDLFMPRMGRQERTKNELKANGDRTVYVLRDGQPVPVPIKIGATNGVVTVVKEGAIKAGDELVVAERKAKKE